MEDKTRQEFEAWAGKNWLNLRKFCLDYSVQKTHWSWLAWQHQQSIIDAQRVEIERLRAFFNAAERCLEGCAHKSWAGYENGNGESVGDAMELARQSILNLEKS